MKLGLLRGVIFCFLAATGGLPMGAYAQVSVVAKTATASSFPDGYSAANAGAWQPEFTVCPFDRKSRPCSQLNAAGQTQERASQVYGSLAADTADVDHAVNAAVSALFHSQKAELDDVSGEADEPDGSAKAINPFQLSETLEWRVEPGEIEITNPLAARGLPANQVGLFASRTLVQAGENASLKFDAGVNLEEGKNSGTAGKAGFAMNW